MQFDDAGATVELVVLREPEAQLEGVIAIHSTALGPAAGGCRFTTYPDFSRCVEDAHRLARGMTFKNAMAGLPLGGGKAVIRRPEGPFDRAALFEAFGHAVGRLKGRYLTAEDVGTTVADMEAVARSTRHVAGLPRASGHPGGDPSPWTARGVFVSMQHAASRVLGKPLSEVSVAIQGVGNVGEALARQLHDAGARLVIADVDSERVAKVAASTGAFVASTADVLKADVDVIAPCALGGAIDHRLLGSVRARIICGGANNQLAERGLGPRLAAAGITYCPDYIANAGGIISVAGEHLGWSAADVAQRVENTADRLAGVLDVAVSLGLSPADAADRLAIEKLKKVGRRPIAA
ncbi:Glu/Leu/Phe/Val dehydrogenase [Novosphingobium sp. Gsoil 351]|uniref:Glu/Leu/Phe/Val family dehydrogenase n=1 Tax=Novosphingobium sp. Gsoil 351 TaxID=2675225 RepID=UPI0012B4A356|nr:Glu/Leu/Phe/Val dehydrogenase dimerization domain-containing protein [Novosphingobium sp. Gsoil 351]QGN55468.1 amino acid dehydrogenase [Novosphingobium sp. Gsoil 351]